MIALTDLPKEAWHTISIDPLVDSDEETGENEYVREDYGRALPVNHGSTSTEPEL
jgi:hypothetical protein